jgi:hypothetical protein
MSVSPTLTPASFAQAALTTADAVLYTVPVGQIGVLQHLTLANSGAAIATVSVSLPGGTGIGDRNARIMQDVPIMPQEVAIFDLYQVFAGGIVASASPATVNLTASGLLFPAPASTWDAATLAWDSVGAGVTWDGYV